MLAPCCIGAILKVRTTKQGKTMNFLDVLNTATADLSDNKLSQKIGISRQTVSSWRTRGSIPEDDILEKLAAIADIPVEKVFYAAYAEKVHNPIVAQLLRQNSHLAA
jgi:transcriptional regulator with XRE-family HTH domain